MQLVSELALFFNRRPGRIGLLAPPLALVLLAGFGSAVRTRLLKIAFAGERLLQLAHPGLQLLQLLIGKLKIDGRPRFPQPAIYA